MSTFVLKREYALAMPSSYVDIDRDEMEYVDGELGAPNWLVAGAVNWVISGLIAGVTGGGALALRTLASRYGKSAAKTIFSNKLKKQLMAKAISAGIASGICSLVGAAFEVMMWAADPGTKFATWFDSRDPRKNNTWCDIS